MVKEQEEQGKDVEETSHEQSSFLEYSRVLSEVANSSPIVTEPVGDRMLSLSNGKVIFVTQAAEIKDSFLVLFPVTLVKDNSGRVEAKAVVPDNVVRVFKSSVMMLSVPSDYYRYFYYKYLSKNMGAIPEIFDKKRQSNVLSFLAEYESIHGKDPSENLDNNEDGGEGLNINFPPYKSKAKH